MLVTGDSFGNSVGDIRAIGVLEVTTAIFGMGEAVSVRAGHVLRAVLVLQTSAWLG